MYVDQASQEQRKHVSAHWLMMSTIYSTKRTCVIPDQPTSSHHGWQVALHSLITLHGSQELWYQLEIDG